LGVTVDPDSAKIRVDGRLLKKQRLIYYAVNKPVGVVTTNRDPQGRPRVVDLVPPDERVFAVGRLDRSSEGLILLTNDGDLAQKLAHPKFGIRKVYRVMVAGKVDGETMRTMRKGIHTSDGFVKVEGVKLLKARARATELEIVLREGKNREIRRILARLGHKVMTLRRIAVGPLRLGEVPPGAYRVLSREEVDKLRRATENPLPDAASGSPRPGKRGGGNPGTARKRATKKQATAKRTTKKKATASAKKATGKKPAASLPNPKPRGGAIIGGDSPKKNR